MRILQSASRKLNIELDKWFANLDRYGNTSAASIPIALCEAVEQGRIKEDDYIAITGFGGGLSWATGIIQWVRPKDEQQISRINQQRRQLSYWLAGWRSRINRWRRNVNRMFRGVLPRPRGSRLQRRLQDKDLK